MTGFKSLARRRHVAGPPSTHAAASLLAFRRSSPPRPSRRTERSETRRPRRPSTKVPPMPNMTAWPNWIGDRIPDLPVGGDGFLFGARPAAKGRRGFALAPRTRFESAGEREFPADAGVPDGADASVAGGRHRGRSEHGRRAPASGTPRSSSREREAVRSVRYPRRRDTPRGRAGPVQDLRRAGEGIPEDRHDDVVVIP